ncbi:pyrroline-5-carboxylate reductase [Massilia sp. W12]|uniref:pyrroline-5-carboxylate reductase n=1 Tax=Massilia sp. W12 TaxID=3126507 RepID=UPI0030D43154
MNLGFIGGGNMASALIAGVARSGMLGRLHVVDINPAQLAQYAHDYPGASTAQEINRSLMEMDVLVLAVKPQQMRQIALQLAPLLPQHGPLIISIAAGIRGVDLQRWLGGYGALVRCMPNTPALIGRGMSGMTAWPDVTAQQKQLAQQVLSAVGATLWLEHEEQLDAVTALSGSGPAYVFYFIEAMQSAAQLLGLSEEQGRQLALATFSGAAELAAQSPEPVAALREKVTSKGGTTQAALTAMEHAQTKTIIVHAIRSAYVRACELGDEFGRA